MSGLRIGIAGCGGIGSNVAIHLVRSGVTDITIADFDRIEQSNLNRQFYFYDQIGLPKAETLSCNLKRINPKLKLSLFNVKLDRSNIAEVFYDCDVIVEAFDRKEFKAILMEEFVGRKKLIVSASGIGGFDLSKVSTREIAPNCFVVGDFETDIAYNKTYSAKVSYVASIMANIVLERCGFYN